MKAKKKAAEKLKEEMKLNDTDDEPIKRNELQNKARDRDNRTSNRAQNNSNRASGKNNNTKKGGRNLAYVGADDVLPKTKSKAKNFFAGIGDDDEDEDMGTIGSAKNEDVVFAVSSSASAISGDEESKMTDVGAKGGKLNKRASNKGRNAFDNISDDEGIVVDFEEEKTSRNSMKRRQNRSPANRASDITILKSRSRSRSLRSNRASVKNMSREDRSPDSSSPTKGNDAWIGRGNATRNSSADNNNNTRRGGGAGTAARQTRNSTVKSEDNEKAAQRRGFAGALKGLGLGGGGGSAGHNRGSGPVSLKPAPKDASSGSVDKKPMVLKARKDSQMDEDLAQKNEDKADNDEKADNTSSAKITIKKRPWIVYSKAKS